MLLAQNPEKEFVLRTGASDAYLDAVLPQKSEGFQHHVPLASRRLSKPMMNYATIEKKCLAIVGATKRCRLLPHDRKFRIETDHRPLEFLKHANSHGMRWSLGLQNQNFHVEDIKGSDHVEAGFMTRVKIYR